MGMTLSPNQKLGPLLSSWPSIMAYEWKNTGGYKDVDKKKKRRSQKVTILITLERDKRKKAQWKKSGCVCCDDDEEDDERLDRQRQSSLCVINSGQCPVPNCISLSVSIQLITFPQATSGSKLRSDVTSAYVYVCMHVCVCVCVCVYVRACMCVCSCLHPGTGVKNVSLSHFILRKHAQKPHEMRQMRTKSPSSSGLGGTAVLDPVKYLLPLLSSSV